MLHGPTAPTEQHPPKQPKRAPSTSISASASTIFSTSWYVERRTCRRTTRSAVGTQTSGITPSSRMHAPAVCAVAPCPAAAAAAAAGAQVQGRLAWASAQGREQHRGGGAWCGLVRRAGSSSGGRPPGPRCGAAAAPRWRGMRRWAPSPRRPCQSRRRWCRLRGCSGRGGLHGWGAHLAARPVANPQKRLPLPSVPRHRRSGPPLHACRVSPGGRDRHSARVSWHEHARRLQLGAGWQQCGTNARPRPCLCCGRRA